MDQIVDETDEKQKRAGEQNVFPVSRVWSENTSEVMTTESQIATPPSMAVGFLCQRSVLGSATKP